VVGSGTNASIWKEWRQANYQVRVGGHHKEEEGEHLKEQFVDEALQSMILDTIHDPSLDKRPQTLVLVTGDGNDEGDHSFPKVIRQAAEVSFTVPAATTTLPRHEIRLLARASVREAEAELLSLVSDRHALLTVILSPSSTITRETGQEVEGRGVVLAKRHLATVL
jgi:hypothetical protein